jgi:hypothetical protein
MQCQSSDTMKNVLQYSDCRVVSHSLSMGLALAFILGRDRIAIVYRH